MAEKENKPIYKKAWFWIVIIVLIIIIIACTGSSENTEENNTSGETTSSSTQELNLGDTWTVDGQWSLTITSVETTSYRNEFSDKTPSQVVYVTFSYENLGYEDSSGIMDGLYFDLEPSGDATVVDGNGEMAYSYPGDITTYAQETPVGATCANAQVCIGLNNESETITMTINKYDSNSNKQTVKYTLSVN